MPTRVNLLALCLCLILAPGVLTAQFNPSTLSRIGTVDPRFQSFNVEMLEVTGGRFWAPYNKKAASQAPAPDTAKASTPAGMDPSLYSYRQPIDLTNPKLRKLAAALGPAYMRVSGTWANTTFFQDSDAPAPATPPAGFNGVLTRSQWRGVIDFAHAVDAEIVTSVAISPGARNAEGVWTSAEADKFFAFTKNAGGRIAAIEMFNEPSIAAMGGAPKGYDAAAYRKDFVAFHAFAKKTAPGMLILGPGSVGETKTLGDGIPGLHLIRSEDMLAAPTPGLDALSYHFYGGVSKRCVQLGAASQTTPDAALSKDWLLRTDRDERFYADLRDRLAPGKPLWVTETGETACGGNPWAADFLDSFRYLVQLGELSRQGVQVVMHNTLAASDYALIDESTLTPRPNYWSALLWRRLMGTTVLDAGPAPSPDLYLYAHCLRNHPGGVALLAINASRTASASLLLPASSNRYTLSATDLMTNMVDLNGKPLQLEANGDLPALSPETLNPGAATLAPASITFFAIENAKNNACSKPLRPLRP